MADVAVLCRRRCFGAAQLCYRIQLQVRNRESEHSELRDIDIQLGGHDRQSGRLERSSKHIPDGEGQEWQEQRSVGMDVQRRRTGNPKRICRRSRFQQVLQRAGELKPN